MPYEIDDLGIRIIGYNVPIEFYDDNRVLQCSISLQHGPTLSICGVSVAAGLTAETASKIFVRLDGNNWNLWQPAGGTQSIVGNFNLAGAALEYKIGGVHALSMPEFDNVFAGDGAEAGGGAESVKVGYQVMPVGYDIRGVAIGSRVMLTNTVGPTDVVAIGANLLREATAGLNITLSNIIGGDALRSATGDISNSDIMGFEALENLGNGGVEESVVLGYRAARDATHLVDSIVIGSRAGETSTDANAQVWIGKFAAAAWASGPGNTAVGFFTAAEVVNGEYDTYMGYFAARFPDGDYNVGIGAHSLYGTNTDDFDNVTAVGAYSGYNNEGSGGVFLGFESGYFETGASKLFIDNIRRASEADARIKALVYGVFHANTADQYFTINGHLIALEDATSAHFISTVAIGTQPYATTSTTLNTNLNADLLDSQHGAWYLDLGNATGILASARGGTGVNNAGTFTNPLNTTITGGGTIALAGFTLTVPETLIAAGRNVANTFTENQIVAADLAVTGTTQLEAWGDSPFTALDGLLLLGPGCPMVEDAWTTLRGQEATISGAFHQVNGRWAGTRALMVEEAGLNLETNPSMALGDPPTGYDDYNTPTRSRTADYAKFGTYSQKVIADAANDGVSDTIAADASEDYTFTVWVRADTNTTIYLHLVDQDDNSLVAAAPHDVGATFQKFVLSAATEAGDTGIKGIVYASEVCTFYIDGYQMEKLTYPTSTCIGNMGTGYAWTGAAHNSTSMRAATEVNLDAYASLLSDNEQWSVSIRWQPQYDADAVWPSGMNILFDVIGASNNHRVIVRYNATVKEYYVFINGADRIITGSSQTFKAGDWQQVLVTIDFDANEYRSYINGSLDAVATTELTAPTGLDEMNLGSSRAATLYSNAAHSEFVLFDRIIGPAEAAAIFEAGHPLTDQGATQTPVLAGRKVLLYPGSASEEAIRISRGADADMTIIKLNVTGAPEFGWREVGHTFTQNAAQHFTVTAHEFGYQAIDINVDAHTYGGVSGLAVNYDATAFVAGILGTALDMIVDNAGASGGEIHALDVAVSDPTNADMMTVAVGTHQGVHVIHQHLGTPANLTSGIEGDQSGGPSYIDRTAAFDNPGVNVQIFDDDDDFILLASATKWDEINVILAVVSSTNIAPTFHYITDAGAWVAFMPSDDTDGFQNSGTIRFDKDTLTTWGVRTISEVTGAALPGGDDYYWIKITRTRNFVLTPPTESTIHVTATGILHEWDSVGRLAIKTYPQATEPDATDLPAGMFCFWTDTDDGKLYLCYNHGGTIKTVEMT